jgi:hypothetical protein
MDTATPVFHPGLASSSLNPRGRSRSELAGRGVCPARKSAVRTSRGEWLNPLGSRYEIPPTGSVIKRLLAMPVWRSASLKVRPPIAGMSWLQMATGRGFAPRRFQAVMCNAGFARLLGVDRDGAIQNSISGVRLLPAPRYASATLAVVLARSRAALLLPGIYLRRRQRAVGMAAPAVPTELFHRSDTR